MTPLLGSQKSIISKPLTAASNRSAIAVGSLMFHFRSFLGLPLCLCLSACAGSATFELRLEGLDGIGAEAVLVTAELEGESLESIVTNAEPRVEFVAASLHESFLVLLTPCSDATCATASGGSQSIRFERPFYHRQRTSFAVTLSRVLGDNGRSLDVGMCSIEGCSGTQLPSYCAYEGRHFCEF
jgi:hypothetical protein